MKLMILVAAVFLLLVSVPMAQAKPRKTTLTVTTTPRGATFEMVRWHTSWNQVIKKKAPFTITLKPGRYMVFVRCQYPYLIDDQIFVVKPNRNNRYHLRLKTQYDRDMHLDGDDHLPWE